MDSAVFHRSRQGATFIVVVVIMALVLSVFALTLSSLLNTRTSTAVSVENEKAVLYLAEDAVNQMIYQLNVNPSSTSIPLTDASDIGPNFKYDASYSSGTKPFNLGSGTVRGTGYLMNPAYPTDTSKAIYSKTVYVEVQPGNAAPVMVYIKAGNARNNIPYYRVWNGADWGNEQAAPAVQGGIYSGRSAPDIQFIKLVFDPSGARAMLGMQDTYGNVWAEEWSGTSFSAAILVYDSGGTGIRNLTSRDFDIAYENTPTNGVYRAVLVFDDEN
ncbi:MAG: type II secretion system protein, partial [Caldisericaceae bacterium]